MALFHQMFQADRWPGNNYKWQCDSKIIKSMPFAVPTDEELEKFHNIAMPLFMMVKSNQRENKYLSGLRDVLLPKLMSGEINVSTIHL